MIKTDLHSEIISLFPSFEKGLIEYLIQNGEERQVKAEDVLMVPGQYFRHTMLVLSGHIKVYRTDENGDEYFLYYIEPGNACALSMICASKNEQAMIKAIALEESTLLTLPIQQMDTMMKEYKSWYYFVLETYRNRFEELLNVIDNIAFYEMDVRLKFYLKNQFKNLNTKELNFTHQQIASDLSSSREVVSRLLKKMEQQGDIALGRNKITLLRLND